MAMQSKAHDVFISYSRKDRGFVQELVVRLEKAGLDVWWDMDDLQGGDDWSRSTQTALEASETVIVVLSPRSVESEWVQREYTLALSQLKRVIPIMYETCPVPFALMNLLYIDFTRGDFESAFARLLRSLREDESNDEPSSQKVADRSAADDNEDDTEPQQRNTTRIPTKILYNASAVLNDVRLLVTVTALGWRIPGVDGLLIRADQRPGVSRPAGAFYHDLMNDMGDRTAADALTELLTSALKATRLTPESPVDVLLPADLGRIVLPFANSDQARLILSTVQGTEERPIPQAVKTMFRNAVQRAARTGLRHLAAPIYLADNLDAAAALTQMLDALQEITDFGSLTQITILTLAAEIVDQAQKYFAEKFNQPAGTENISGVQWLEELQEANRLINNRAQAIANDNARGDDKLGIANEVYALADTLLLREVEPPLAVGVMGGWGSGKSFVMHLIHKRAIETRAKQVKQGWPDVEKGDNSKIPAYVGHIYQIDFHAWTYAKANLWASLMQTIFVELNRQMRLEQLLAYKDFPKDAQPTKEELQARLRQAENRELIEKLYQKEIDLSRDPVIEPWRENLTHWANTLVDKNFLWQVMRNKQSQKNQELKRIAEQAKTLKDAHAQYAAEWAEKSARIMPSDPLAKTAYLNSMKEATLGFASDMLAEKAEEIAAQQNIDIEQIKSALTTARQTITNVQSLWNTFRQNKIYWLWAATFVAISFALPYVWTRFGLGAIETWVTTALKLATLLLPIVVKLSSWLEKIVAFNAEAKQILENAQQTLQTKEVENIAGADDLTFEKKKEALQEKIKLGYLPAYDALVTLLDQRAEMLRADIGTFAKFDSLLEFVEARLAAGIYESQLGPMHQIQQDLRELSYNLVENADHDAFPRGTPRILLYIDDLDRCPPESVVKVLEAVRLLLDTGLFIAILGLDTRYVTRALEKEYKEILQPEGDPSGLDYIEKIIQIPYRVRSIEVDGMQQYLQAQMEIEAPPKRTPPAAPDGFVESVVEAEERNNAQSQEVTPMSELPEGSANLTVADSAAGQDRTPQEKASELELPTAVIQFKPEDLEDLSSCCQQVTSLTPRSIKRLVNVLKLMKVFWFRAFQDDKPRRVKQAVMSMLALSAAYPEVMREAFATIEQAYHSGRAETYLFETLKGVQLPSYIDDEIAWQLDNHKHSVLALEAVREEFGQVTLAELTLPTFNLIRSFSFVGDPGQPVVHFRGRVNLN